MIRLRAQAGLVRVDPFLQVIELDHEPSQEGLALLLDASASQEAVLPNVRRAAQTFISEAVRPERDLAAVIVNRALPSSGRSTSGGTSSAWRTAGARIIDGARSPR